MLPPERANLRNLLTSLQLISALVGACLASEPTSQMLFLVLVGASYTQWFVGSYE